MKSTKSGSNGAGQGAFGHASRVGVIFAALALPLLGCAGVDDSFDESDDEAIGSTEQALLDDNGWDHNGWLADNGWSVAYQGQPDDWAIAQWGSNTNARNWISGVTRGYPNFKTAQYLARCALPSGVSLDVTLNNGNTKTLQGALGLVPTWQTSPMTNNADRQIITSCLLAHANANGTSVQVSFRGNVAPINHVSAQEHNATPYYEATFYGNIFTDPNRVYVCQGDHGDNPKTGRSCSDSTGTCQIIRTGMCSDVCAPRVNPGYHPSCTGWNANFYYPISTWNSTL